MSWRIYTEVYSVDELNHTSVPFSFVVASGFFFFASVKTVAAKWGVRVEDQREDFLSR